MVVKRVYVVVLKSSEALDVFVPMTCFDDSETAWDFAGLLHSKYGNETDVVDITGLFGDDE